MEKHIHVSTEKIEIDSGEDKCNPEVDQTGRSINQMPIGYYPDTMKSSIVKE